MLITPAQAFDQHLHNIYLTASGTVAEILPDDLIGVKHQRFILLTPEGQTILIVYNISNNVKINLKVGDKIQVSGTYMWNKYGGMLHETHSGVNKDHPDGQIVIQ
jgi:hypothetical protein